MRRKALIIYCSNTASGDLNGPIQDNLNFRTFLTSPLGGSWYPDEIISLENPTSVQVSSAITLSMINSDYTFVIFTGHGYIDTNNHHQYIELRDKNISIQQLITDAPRQTMIIDACRGYHTPGEEDIYKALSEAYSNFQGVNDTRKLFNDAVLNADEGLTILYAASENQTALDTNNGAAYLLSLLRVSRDWERFDNNTYVLAINYAHELAKTYISRNFPTIQKPTMIEEKRNVHFPFAVKYVSING